MVDLDICTTKIYWNKLNFPSKCNFKSDEDRNKHSLEYCKLIVKMRHILLAFLCPEFISKIDPALPNRTRPNPNMTLFDCFYLQQYYGYWIDPLHMLDSMLKIVLFKFRIDVFYSLETTLLKRNIDRNIRLFHKFIVNYQSSVEPE